MTCGPPWGSRNLKRGRPEQAAIQFQMALDLGETRPLILGSFGLALLHSGHTQQAVEALEAAVHLEPENAEFRNNLGTALAQAEQYERAADRVREGGRNRPGL